MNRHVSSDPLERLIARFDESVVDEEYSETGSVPVGGSVDPLSRLGAWILAAHDLSKHRDEIGKEGVMGEIGEWIDAARIIEPVGDLGLRVVDSTDPRARIAAWVRDEREALGGMPAIVRVRAADPEIGNTGSVNRLEGRATGESGVEAAVGRAVLSMIGDVELTGRSRQRAVELLAVAMEEPSPQALQAVLRILIAGD